jgi:NAD-dependent dihydropyrimidine dehydrogenase PreA subunit
MHAPASSVKRLNILCTTQFSIVTINEEKGQHDHSMLIVRRDICGYCGCCVSVCPEGALELIDAYLSVEKNCTSCGVCAKVCPLGALEVVNEG